MAVKVGLTKSFTFIGNVTDQTQFECPKTGLKKKFGQLTDEEIDLMIHKGNKDFTRISEVPLKTLNESPTGDELTQKPKRKRTAV